MGRDCAGIQTSILTRFPLRLFNLITPVVGTQIAAASGQGYVLDYVMRQESGGWKVVDVLADGAISRVAAQRSEMRSMLALQRPDIIRRIEAASAAKPA